jgi:hypothetical protein
MLVLLLCYYWVSAEFPKVFGLLGTPVVAKPKRHPAGIVTIGYEGRSLENYLNELLCTS